MLMVDPLINPCIFRGDISTAVDVHIPKVNATKGVFVAARVDHGGCGSLLSLGVYFWVFPGTQRYEVTTDLGEIYSTFSIYQIPTSRKTFHDLDLN